MTNDAVKRLTKLGERQRIRRRPVRNQENIAIGFKKIAHGFANTARPLIIAIRFGGSAIRFFERSQNFRTHSGGVVAG